MSSWHGARREAIFWRTLGGGQLGNVPPNVLQQAVCRGPDESLPAVFRGFLAHLPDLEEEAGGDLGKLQQLIEELLPNPSRTV